MPNTSFSFRRSWIALLMPACALSAAFRGASADLVLNGRSVESEASLATARGDWKILKTEWSPSDEARFSDFVAAIGKTDCRTINACLKSVANPYRATDPAGSRFSSDCADLPYVFRTYFAWKNGLPFGYVSSVAPNPAPATVGPPRPLDIRYSPKGNHVESRANVTSRVDANGEIQRASGLRVLSDVLNTISSALFRVGPASETAARPNDFYPVALTRSALRPGTAIYDPAGHVAVVYSVEGDGRILFIDAHPDNSVTRGTYGKKFARSNPAHGAGFKNWRPVRLVGGTKAASGEWVGGKVVPFANAELNDYSTVQYYGTNPDPKGSWNRGRFAVDGTDVDYYDYLRRVLSVGTLRYEPLGEFALLIRGLCTDLKDRAASVELAVTHGISEKAHPLRLPSNIYGTSGEWEDYATPSRDARLKTSFKEARDRAAEFIALWQAKDPGVVYEGVDLRSDLRAVLEKESSACEFTYVKSDGTSTPLNVIEAAHRAFTISFDPYHCPELRWGATAAAELASCADGAGKRDWYAAERKLRNQIERTYDARMDFPLEGMRDPRTGGALGVETAPAVDLWEFLR